MVDRSSRIFVAGHRGLAGSAILQKLSEEGYDNLITRNRTELDLTRQDAVAQFFHSEHPDCVFLAAARVGGILANSMQPADFIRENLLIQTNVIDAAYQSGAKLLIFLGSSCVYPKYAPQPLKEEYLLSGPLEPTNDAYAVAKIAGIKMCQAYRHQFGFNAISLMPTNLYGPGDNFDLETSHVLSALIKKFDQARLHTDCEVTVWGTGAPRREFMHVNDLASACTFLIQQREEVVGKVAPDGILNVGTGKDLQVKELALLIGRLLETECRLVFDASKPDGTPQKLLDVSRMKSLGWTYKIELPAGIRNTYQWYQQAFDAPQ